MATQNVCVQLDTSDPRQRDLVEWSEKNSAITGQVYCLGYAVFSSGLQDYYRTFYKADEWKVQELQVSVDDAKRRLQEAEMEVDERVLKRVKNETVSLRADCEFLQRQVEQKDTEIKHISESLENTVVEKTQQEAIRIESSWLARMHVAEKHLALLQAEKERSEAAWKERLHSLQESKEMEVGMMRTKWEEVTREVCRMSESHISAEMAALKEQLKLKDNEIQVLKSGNFVKGRAGENLIKEYLQEHFTEWMVEYKGKNPHECDMHMVNSSGDIVMIESKNKDAIAKSDVDKFYNDIAHMEASERPCLGAVFVSIRTRNIPWKGQVFLEMVNKRPALFLGFGNEEDLQLHLANYVRVFLQYASITKHQTSDVSADTMFTLLNAQFQGLLSTKVQIDRLKMQHGEMTKTVSELERLHQKSVMGIEVFLKQNNRFEVTGGSNGHGAKNIYTCSTCSETFTNKKLFEKHGRICSSSPTKSVTI